jgi:DNA-binding transcriptional regulator YiaG
MMYIARRRGFTPKVKRKESTMRVRTMDAARVAEIRHKMGLNITDFARECNTSRQTVHNWENGSRIPDGTSVRLLELLESLHDERSRNDCEGA